MAEYRIENDSMGEVHVPTDALYGAQTQRAIDNFKISDLRLPRSFIRAVALIKLSAADANKRLGLLPDEIANAITMAALEVANGDWDDQFPIDVFQTGSATSANMNANEVIAHRAIQIKGVDKAKIHPNDHVNKCQSSNDVIPSAIHVSALMQINEILLPGLKHLHSELMKRADECEGIIKTGRTHLMDAMPVSFGQELGGWAFQISQSIERLESCIPRISMLAIGGTAVGTGINAHPEFAGRLINKLNEMTEHVFTETENHFAAQSSLDTMVELSGHLKAAASVLMKIANDLRWMNSGPNAGIAEIALPELQPGSSIMPGKVNPVICESVLMACAQVIGNDAAVTAAASIGSFELNTAMPLIAFDILQSISILGNAARLLADKAVSGFTINEKRISELLEKNPILITVLAPKIGYDKAAKIAKKAAESDKTIKEIAAEELNMSQAEVSRLFDPKKMISKGILS